MNDDVAHRDRSPRGWPLDAEQVWELRHWHLGAVVRRIGEWIRASRRRHRAVVLIGIILGLTVIPGCIGAVAMAQGDSPGAAGGNGALSWMNVRDSAGVSVSRYTFAFNTDAVGILHPFNTAMATAISLEFAGWMVIVVTGIWLIGFVLSFRWMDLFATPLRAVAAGFTEQVSIPIVLITAASIGAFCVAWFVLRGFHAKAVMQVVTMLGVAVLGPMFLADPLADVLSSDGWLSQGRDLGITVAAGLNGDRNPQPNAIVASMQEQLADNFARKPLQVWNFGHVIDDRPACGAAWTNSVATGDDDRIKNAMRSCGDGAAYDAAKEPTAGQFGAGLLVLVSGTLLLAFGAVLAMRIVRSALDSVYHGFLAIFGFAAGGFVYGPTQTFLVRSVVHSLFAALRMAVQVIFLGVYVLFLGDIFKHAQGQVMSVFVMGAILEVIAISQLKRLDASLDRGNDWVANRFSQTLHGATQQGSGGGGTALGMGNVGAQRHGLGILKTFAAASVIGGSPLTALALQRRNPALPFSELETAASLANWGAQSVPGLGGPMGWNVQSMLNRQMFAESARRAAEKTGGIDTVLGAAAAIQGAIDVGAGIADLNGALQGAGFTDTALISRAVKSWNIAEKDSEGNVLSDKHLAHTAAALNRAQTTTNRLTRGGGRFKPGDSDQAAADIATLQASAYRLRRRRSGGVTLDEGSADHPQLDFVNDYMDRPSQSKLIALANVINGTAAPSEEQALANPDAARLRRHMGVLADAGVARYDADRMWAWIGNEHAKRILGAANALAENPDNRELMQEVRRQVVGARDSESWTPNGMRTPLQQFARPRTSLPDGDWTAMAGVAERLRRRA
ncbi:hypothetical protein OHB26_23305 [Nocardia sp. NBC_01503]|uniref:hypothetical protein n=1 Tax=Nocardia sp. NBC_01503 TaxID=2975997 RepID=UPI002E7ABE6F|nr:hypothetical protein [Nocardia sp. NBC_01503]WTL29885.1 hypothetical protein OHB26_23305 [Nocardia sp. NBC_01503]